MNENVQTILYVVGSVGAVIAVIYIFMRQMLWRFESMTEFVADSRRMHSRETDSESRSMLSKILDLLESTRSFQSHAEENRSRRDFELENTLQRFQQMGFELRELRDQIAKSVQLSEKTVSELSAASKTKETTNPDLIFSVYQQVSSEFSHSIKTPAASIEAAITNIKEKFDNVLNNNQLPPPAELEILNSFLENAAISVDYIKSILRRGAGFFPGEAEQFSVQAILRKAIRMTSETVKRPPQISVSVDNLPDVKFYWLNLLIPITQVLENAFEAVQENGEIKITGKRNPKTGVVSILISNNGQPIPQNTKSKIFEYGFSTKGSQRGSGLAIARRSLSAVNAKLELMKSDKRSTEFVISFSPQEVFE